MGGALRMADWIQLQPSERSTCLARPLNQIVRPDSKSLMCREPV